MFDDGDWPAEVPRARGLRWASRLSFGVWVVTIVAFGIAVWLQAGSDEFSSLGAVASIAFAAGVLFRAIAHRREWRQYVERTAREDLRALRSRR